MNYNAYHLTRLTLCYILVYSQAHIVSQHVHNFYPGVAFSLRGDYIPTDGSRHVNSTDTDEDALICCSELTTADHSGSGNWFLLPNQMSINQDHRINPISIRYYW